LYIIVAVCRNGEIKFLSDVYNPNSHMKIQFLPDVRFAVWTSPCVVISTFLQRVSIACYAKRCISYRKSVRPSDWPSDWPSVTRWYHAKTTQAMITGSSLEDSPTTLVSSWLTSERNSKGNIGSEGGGW